mmetsp:Transcript_30634/g.81912  ORF Transcript_30634/g.81912 Transcript_30634/m.81912 type:complete len:272 (-) Transcript_30634:66-881(-)
MHPPRAALRRRGVEPLPDAGLEPHARAHAHGVLGGVPCLPLGSLLPGGAVRDVDPHRGGGPALQDAALRRRHPLRPRRRPRRLRQAAQDAAAGAARGAAARGGLHPHARREACRAAAPPHPAPRQQGGRGAARQRPIHDQDSGALPGVDGGAHPGPRLRHLRRPGLHGPDEPGPGRPQYEHPGGGDGHLRVAGGRRGRPVAHQGLRDAGAGRHRQPTAEGAGAGGVAGGDDEPVPAPALRGAAARRRGAHQEGGPGLLRPRPGRGGAAHTA